MSPATDPVEDYLDQLYASLHTTPRQGRRILAEAENHLREATAAGIKTGLSQPEAEQAAISSFGPVRAVVRAHTRQHPPTAIVSELAMAAWQLASIAVLAVGASGAVALLLNQITSQFHLAGTYGLGLNVCVDWTSAVHFPACAQDALRTSTSTAGHRLLILIPGLVLLTSYLLTRRHQRNHGYPCDLLPDAFLPTMATCLFGAFTIALTVLAALVPPGVGGNLGSGNWLSAAIATLLAAISFLPALRRALLQHTYS